MIKQLTKLNNFMQSKTMSAIDWVIGIGIVGYAVYLFASDGPTTNAYITFAVGIFSFILAYIKPVKIIKAKLDKVIINRQIKNS